MTTRPIYTTEEKDKLATVYQASIDSDIRCLHCLYCCAHPCSFLFVPLVSDMARHETYVTIHENRLEFNYPTSTLMYNCNCHTIDDVRVIYFDQTILNDISILQGCCCGYNKTVVLRQPVCECSTTTMGCCGRVYLPCIEQPDAFVEKLQTVRSERIKKAHIEVEMER